MMPLLVSHNDGPSGAGRAVARLHQGLLQSGVPSRLLVARSQAALAETYSPAGPLRRGIAVARSYADQIPLTLYPGRERTFFSTGCFAGNPATGVRQSLDYHLVHLHWINGGFVSPSAFARFGKPLLWTIHDSWAFTGGCHVPGDCVRYEENCGACPRLGSRRSFDLSRIIWRRKHKAWRDLAINLIAPSNWMADCIRRSSLLGERQVHVIPNAIDTRIYQPFDRATARRRLGLPLDHRIILFGAINATADGNKGYDLLQSSLALYTQKHRPGTCLAIFGSKRDPRGGEKLFVAGAPSGGLPVYQLGGFQDDLALALVYSAADVMCVPSRQESFGQTAAEAMACGTPVVAFGATGLLDIVDHKKNGYLARPYDPEDFAAGIDFVLRAPRLGPAARKKVERAFALEQVARRHIELYDSLT